MRHIADRNGLLAAGIVWLFSMGVSRALVIPKAYSSRSFTAMFDKRSIPGVSPPVGYFDPLGFSTGLPEKRFKRWRESEVRHFQLVYKFGNAFKKALKCS